MRKLLLTLILFPIITLSQDVFTAKEAFDFAKSEVNGEFVNPTLRMIGSSNGESFNIGITFNTIFEEETGEANNFIFIFTESDNLDEGVVIPVIKGFGQFVNMSSFPGISDIFPYDEFKEFLIDAPIGTNWIDSDDFVFTLNNSDSHNNLRQKHNDSQISSVSLVIDSEDDSPTYGDPYWYVQYSLEDGTDTFYCVTNAIEETVFCEEDISSGIIELNENNSVMGPNPAINSYSISIDNMSIDGIQVLDIFGNLIDTEYSISSNKLTINTQNLTLGTYFVKIAGNNKTYLSKFIKSE